MVFVVSNLESTHDGNEDEDGENGPAVESHGGRRCHLSETKLHEYSLGQKKLHEFSLGANFEIGVHRHSRGVHL